MVNKFTIYFYVDGHRRRYSIDCVNDKVYLLRYRNVIQGAFDNLLEAFAALVADFDIRFTDYENEVISDV